MIIKHNFKTRGVGLITTEFIQKNTYIGNYLEKNIPVTAETRIIKDGWIETTPYGRYLNHNSNSNLYFVMKENKVELYSKQDIKEYTELTVSYTDFVKLMDLPESFKNKFNIIDFKYIDEDIKITKQII